MKNWFLGFFPLFILNFILLGLETAANAQESVNDVCISDLENDLFEMINDYRDEQQLSRVPLSKSLTLVAQIHAKDLVENYTPSKECNPHSWSSKGDWTSCCYTNDHKKADCMWNKPKEIAGYDSPGYEIAFWHSAAAIPGDALEGWKKSQAHNPVIVNEGQWQQVNWKALGVGIYKNYAVVWFGEKEDQYTPPYLCN